MKNKKTIQTIATIGLILLARLSFATLTGPSTNLCPQNTVGYTYNSETGCAPNMADWVVQGGTIISQGNTATLGDYIIVVWDNTTSGIVHNSCGTLNVSILGIAQPTISPSTQLLCGSNTITLQASVSSTANITGYRWDIEGTGVSQTGIVNTTGPQLTLTYSNWNVSNPKSATVAVGTVNSCGFKTDVTPLTTQNLGGGITIPAIPRSAWVQLSTGNINNLLVPYNFTPSVICSTGTMQITNQPAGTNLAWSSGNTSMLTVDPSTGAATRINNLIGNVTVSATVSNACGSNTESTNVWLGLPDVPGPISGNTTPNVGNTEVYSFSTPGNGATSYNWILPYNSSGCTYCWSIYSYNNPQNISAIVGSSAGRVQAVSVNNCGTGGAARLYVSPTGTPGCSPCPSPINDPHPNPANKELNVGLGDVGVKKEVILFNHAEEKVIDVFTTEAQITLSVQSLPDGIYYLHVIDGVEVFERQVVIKH